MRRRRRASAVQSDESLEGNKDSSLVMEPSKTASEHDLIPVIWQKLPTELLNVVLTKLPASALQTFCLVSKSWKALIQSPEFVHQCSFVESVVCYLRGFTGSDRLHPYIAKPNLKTGSWEKRSVDVDNEKLDKEYHLIAADHGSYKLIIAFIDADLTRETFIYDSTSESWTVSGAILPALGGDDDEDEDRDILEKGYITERIIERSVRCGDQLFWLVGMDTDDDGWLRTVIQYNMKLETWSAVSKLWPYHEEYAEGELKQEENLPIHLACFENQIFMVNFNSSSERQSLRVSEFTNLIPGMRKFGLEEFGSVAGNGTWFVECSRDTGNGPGTYEWTVFAFSKNGSVIQLSRLHVMPFMELCPLTATLKAFV
ncbi:hypothetical protein R1sor_023798 [Riccia sorocarpa]|uniref:F-box domain-containing protein n=1 Tax=Riccia sorocarpa TaxID=122646 RepID=A0ABD3GRP6_9MARC